jgi:glycosyltransferase involved in cell wall biosynthesis
MNKIKTTLLEYGVYYVFRIYWKIIRKEYKRKRALKEKPRLLFASTPIISYKYWARAMAKVGYLSQSMTFDFPLINVKEDFDLYFNDIDEVNNESSYLRQLIQKYLILTYVLKNYDILFTSYKHQFLSQTKLWRKEAWILKYFGIKIVVEPYGNDFYMFSKVIDHSVKHNLLICTNKDAFDEELITEKAIYWKNLADIAINGIMLDGASRWDAIPVSFIHIDTEDWKPRLNYTDHNGRNGIVKIAHTPNHRGFKGTEFIINAVKELKKEGLLIELILIEGKPNSEVKVIMQEHADILAEQIIATAYALSGIEGMSCGLPVLSNLDRNDIVQVFRRYSYLNECPILSSTPENIKENLRILIKNPQLRKELGLAGRKYVEKYHSYKAAQYLFEKIIDKIWYGKKIDLMNMYHPLDLNSYNNQSEIIKHPLVENKIPKEYFDHHVSN